MKHVVFGLMTGFCAISATVTPVQAQNYAQEVIHSESYMGEDLPPASASDEAILKHIPDLKKTARGYQNSCGTRTDPRLRTLDLGGTLHDAKVVYDPDSGCWGAAGGQLTILDGANRVVYSESVGAILVLSSRHDGVRDLSFGVPGMSQPIWIWDAVHHQYKFLKSIEE